MNSKSDDAGWPEDRIIAWMAEREAAADTSSVRPEEVPPGVAAQLNRYLRGIRLLQWSAAPQPGTLDHTPGSAGGESIFHGASLFAPEFLARYRLERQLGKGGFGVVYLCRDLQLGRDVAVKVPRADVVLTRETVARFLREAQHVATLHHPNIVPVFAIESTHPLPALVYHYCRGPTLSRWLRERKAPVPTRLAAEIVRLLAEAVHHAHSRGIVHRDLKPGNVLLDSSHDQAGRGFRDGDTIWVPRITDFGIAKAVDGEHEETHTGVVLGTPEYMSPEQALGQTGEIGTHSDIFALGVILIELLTGRPPFRGNTPVETQARLLDCSPPSLRRSRRDIPRDLEAIALKCLARDYTRRYSSAAALADDLRRFLDGRVVSVQSDAWWQSALRWSCRNPAIAGLLTVAVFLATGLVASLAWHSYSSATLQQQLRQQNDRLSRTVGQLDEALETSRQQRQLAETNELRSLELLYVTDLHLAAAAWRRSDPRSAALELASHASALRGRVAKEFAWRYLHHQVTAPSRLIANVDQTIWHIASSPNGRWLAVAGNKGLVALLDATDFRLARTLDTGQQEVNSTAFSPDSQTLATAGDDGRIGLWEVTSGRHLRWFDVLPGVPVFGVAFLDQGRQLVAGGKSPQLSRWDVNSGENIQTIVTPHSRAIEALAVSSDGRLLATAGADGQALLYQVGEAEPRVVLTGVTNVLSSIQFSPDGQHVVTGSRNGEVHVYETSSGDSQVIIDRSEGIGALAVNSRGQIVCSDRGGVMMLFQPTIRSQAPDGQTTETVWKLQRMWTGHDSQLHGLAFTPDGNAVVSGNAAGQVRWWDLTRAADDHVFPPRVDSPEAESHLKIPILHSVTLKSDSETVYRAGPWGLEARKITGEDPALPLIQGDFILTCCLIPEERIVLLGDIRGRVGWLSEDSPHDVEWLEVFGAEGVDQLVSIRSQGQIAVLSRDHELAILDGKTRAILKRLPERNAFTVSPDGRWLVSGLHGSDELVVQELPSFEIVARRTAHRSSIRRIEFTRGGELLVTASDDRTAVLWDTRNWQPMHTLLGHAGGVAAVASSPDMRTLATGDNTGAIRLWDITTGEEMFELSRNLGEVRSLQFTEDGEKLVAVGRDLYLYAFFGPRDPRE